VWLSKYIAIGRTGFREAIAYRFDAVMSLGTSLLYLLLYYAIWSSIASSGSIEGGLAQVMAYLVVGQVVNNTISMQPEDFIGERVRQGTIVNELKRPVSLRGQMYMHELGWSVFRLFSRGLPVLIAGALFFGVTVPSPLYLGAFCLALFFSLNLMFAIGYVTAMLVFWTKVSWSIRMMRNIVQNLFSGVLFPLYLLPDGLATVFNALPFQSMVDGPISIFTMEATGQAAVMVLLKQMGWFIVLLVLGEAAWRYAKTKLTVQGG